MIVFVVDKSSGSRISGFNSAIRNFLKHASNEEIAVVVFDAWCHDAVKLVSEGRQSSFVPVKGNEDLLFDSLTYPLAYDEKYRLGGSNSESAVRFGRELLESRPDIPDTDKTLVLITNLETYVYSGDIVVDGKVYRYVPVSRYGHDAHCCLDAPSGYLNFAELYNDWRNGVIKINKNQYFRYDVDGDVYPWANFWNNIFDGVGPDVNGDRYRHLMETEWHLPLDDDIMVNISYNDKGEKTNSRVDLDQIRRQRIVNGNDVSLMKTYDELAKCRARTVIFSICHDGSDGTPVNWNRALHNKPVDCLHYCHDKLGTAIYGRGSDNEASFADMLNQLIQ